MERKLEPGESENTSDPKKWVKFGEETDNDPDNIESGEIRLPTSSSSNSEPATLPAIIEPSIAIVPTVQIQSPSKSTDISSTKTNASYTNNSGNRSTDNPTFVNIANLQNVELRNSETNLSGSGSRNGTARRTNTGFTNGDVIVSILPVNTRWPWITPASFRPELVPEELMVPGLTLTVEEFVHAMELLTSDFRFNSYTICYKRLLASWLTTAFIILLIILFSGVAGVGLFALGISWLIINAAAVFLCMYIKIKINQGLERCLARVNKLLIKHKLILGLDDRGRISCHKVHLCFIYFDPTECIKRLDQVLDGAENRQRVQAHLDSSDVEIVITGSQNITRIPQKQRGEQLFLRYVQRWAKDFLRRRLDWTVGESSENPSAQRHLTSALCPCQYVEEYLRHKPSELLFLRYIQRWAKDYVRELATSPNSTALHCPRQQCPCQYVTDILQEKKNSVGCSFCQLLAGATPIQMVTGVNT